MNDHTIFKIVAVDDEPTILDSFNKILSPDYEVKTLNDPLQALEYVRDNEIQILITDVKMPGMDGLSLMRESLNIRPDLMVIIITGYPDLKDAVSIMQEGAFHYITKPFTPKEIQDVKKRSLCLYSRMPARAGRPRNGPKRITRIGAIIMPMTW